MRLSILIPSIPSRFNQLQRIFATLEHQAKGRDVEILCFLDNKKRSIGYKRDALVQMSKGDYVSFVDDDDQVSGEYVTSLLQGIEHKPDVVTFNQKCIIDDRECIVDFDLHYKSNQPFTPDKVIKRRPFHVCAFRGDIARRYRFEDSMYGEDWMWCEQLLKDVKTQYKINEIIHTYIFDKEVTEAL